MKKMKAPKKGMMKYLIIVPVILAFTLIATATAQNTKTIHGKVYLEKDGEGAIGASVVITGGTTGTVVNENGDFTLKVVGNPEISISFVGYKSVNKTAGEIMDGPVILLPTAYELSLEEFEFEQNDDENEKVDVKSQSSNSKDEIFYIVENLPSFPGGSTALKNYIENHLKYPKDLNNKMISGEVLVEFKVTAKGKIEDIVVNKTSNSKLNLAAKNVFKDMPDWNPGAQRGKPVNTRVIVPVRFNPEQE